MARFIATCTGRAKSVASRLGTPTSGIKATARGWNIGGSVYMTSDGDADIVEFYLDEGSNGGHAGKRIIAFRLPPNGTVERIK